MQNTLQDLLRAVSSINDHTTTASVNNVEPLAASKQEVAKVKEFFLFSPYLRSKECSGKMLIIR